MRMHDVVGLDSAVVPPIIKSDLRLQLSVSFAGFPTTGTTSSCLWLVMMILIYYPPVITQLLPHIRTFLTINELCTVLFQG